MFYTINSSSCSAEESTDNPFCQLDSTYFAAYEMILGNFDFEHFETKFSTFLYVVYTFLMVIIITNFLIAIISDSYEKSMSQVAQHFGRARIMFIVEVMAFLNIFSKSRESPDDKEDLHGTSQGFCRRCCCNCCCNSCLCCRCFLKWVFLFYIFFKALDHATLENWGSFVGWCIFFFVALFWFFDPKRRLRKWTEIWYRRLVTKSLILKWFGSVLLRVFSIVLGKSSDIYSAASSSNKESRKENQHQMWGGRLERLKKDISKSVLESEYRTRASHSALEHRISRLENDMKDIKTMLEIIVQCTVDKKTGVDDDDESFQ